MITLNRWHASIVITALLLVTALFNYEKSFPVLDIDFSINSQQAEEKAISFLQKNHLYDDKDHSVSIVKTNHPIKNYLELKSGPDQLQRWVDKNLFPIVYWSVRFYQPEQIKESYAYLSPQGKVIGFEQRISENQALPLISKKTAIQLALKNLKQFIPAKINMQLIDYSTHKQPHRLDHTLVFKDPRINLPDKGLNIRTIIISGNQVTANIPDVRIPESFRTHYADLRSYHNNISLLSSIGMVLLLILLGGQGVLHLIKQKLYAFKACFGFAVTFAFLNLINSINHWSQNWFFYTTTTPTLSFQLSLIGSAAISAASSFFFVGFLMATAEGLDRQIRPHGPQLFQCWRSKLLQSDLIKHLLARGWFIFVGILIYVISYYAITTHYFNFWQPTNTESDPNILSTPFPWIQAVIGALTASVTEECWFRAIPIAMTSIWVQQTQRSSLWVYLVATLSAIIWAGAHANYPVSPYYARVIELSIAGMALNYCYVRFGLIPVILGHFLFDLLLMGMPIFMGATTHYFLSQGILIFLLSSPLIIWLISLTKHVNFDTSYLNNQFKYVNLPKVLTHKEHNTYISTNSLTITFIFCLIVISTYPWVYRPLNITPLNISQDKAIELAYQKLHNLNIKLDDSKWEQHVLAFPANDSIGWAFISQNNLQNPLKANPYRLALSYPTWSIKWNRSHQDTSANLLDRQESFEISFNGLGEMTQYSHELPENKKTDTLTKLQFIESTKPLLPTHGAWSLKDTHQETHPQGRKDWSATYRALMTDLPKNSDFLYQITLSGMKLLHQSYSLKIPEKWIKNHLSFQAILKHFNNVSMMTLILIIFYSLYLGIQHLAHRPKKPFLQLFLALSCLLLPLSYLNLPSLLYFLPTVGNHAQTLLIQIGLSALGSLVQLVVLAGLLNTSLASYTYQNTRPHYQMYSLGFVVGCTLYIINEWLLLSHNTPQLNLPFIHVYNTLEPTLYTSLEGLLAGITVFVSLILINLRQKLPKHVIYIMAVMLALSLPSSYTQSISLYLTQALIFGCFLAFIFLEMLSKDWRAFTACFIGYKLIHWLTLSLYTPELGYALTASMSCLIAYGLMCITLEKEYWKTSP
ncbi:MAG TPA: CPBP family intramembrane glutamic endopeptidase [Gammaproteobacteria bacterium]|nr:CPBP family intramembrane glutamic endopeptidase [Gammaproteobacteria bacterium]